MPPTLFAPRYWLTWIGLGVMRLIERLPYPLMMSVGRGIGRFARLLPLGFVKVVSRNIELCLPELSSAERKAVVNRHFQSLGMGLCESAMTWWSAPQRIIELSRLEGTEYLDAALARGKGVILLTAHFTTLEISAAIINFRRPISVLYRPPKNELLAYVMHKRRDERATRAIMRDDIRSMVRALRNNDVVWYAPDQSYRKKGARMVPFFGVPAATNVATTRLAEMTGAAVLFFSHERLPDEKGYRAVIHPPLEGFPSDDAFADTLSYHHFIEGEIRRIPEQYWWIHRRFKGLGADYPDYYR